MQRIGNVLFDPGLEVFNLSISEPGIFELADIEAKLVYHCLDASDAQLNVRVLEIDSIVTEITDKEIGNGQMPDHRPLQLDKARSRGHQPTFGRY